MYVYISSYIDIYILCLNLSNIQFFQIGVRNYQIVTNSDKADGKNGQLIEIGPRFVMIPIRIFSGSLGGATLYQNQVTCRC